MMRSNQRYVSEIVDMWKNDRSADFPYFAKYDTADATDPFWKPGTLFARAFRQLDLACTLEIACGTGRHSARIVDKVGALYMIDTSPDALAVAKARFSEYPHVQVLNPSDGESIPLDACLVTAVFCFDAMVHFEATTVANYLSENKQGSDLRRAGAIASLGVRQEPNRDIPPEPRMAQLHERVAIRVSGVPSGVIDHQQRDLQ
jgi:SAM-dependent methyltransferase